MLFRIVFRKGLPVILREGMILKRAGGRSVRAENLAPGDEVVFDSDLGRQVVQEVFICR